MLHHLPGFTAVFVRAVAFASVVAQVGDELVVRPEDLEYPVSLIKVLPLAILQLIPEDALRVTYVAPSADGRPGLWQRARRRARSWLRLIR